MALALQLRDAVAALRAGGVIAYPTEAVWGLGCEPTNRVAVQRILELKRRDWRKGLIVIGASFEQLEPYVQLPSNSALRRAQASWPGPATWVFPASDFAPDWISGAHELMGDSIAIRVTAHPVAAALCKAYGGAIVSTSANRQSQEPARSATQVRMAFGRRIDALVPGALGDLSRPTPIRHVASGLILRR
ncbi:MAG: tRNA threonylcarbamoyladenosine biosynthesis protein RimN [Nevskia sp.]|nr:tRNA threonylcarbamoyladenosine biosynthesis protein RimN [Nevskia sp.]